MKNHNLDKQPTCHDKQTRKYENKITLDGNSEAIMLWLQNIIFIQIVIRYNDVT